MKITKKMLKEDDVEFCFCCGKSIKETYIMNFGTSGSTFEFCKSCLRDIKNKAEKVLLVEGRE